MTRPISTREIKLKAAQVGALAALTLFAGVGAVRAQENDPFADFDENASYVIDVFYPKLFFTLSEGLGAGFHYAIIRDLDDLQYGVIPASRRASLTFNGHLTTAGSRFTSLVLAAPATVDGWRFFAELNAIRRNRDNYHGLGNASQFDGALITDSQKHFYRAQRDLFRIRGEVQRTVVDHVRVMVGFNYDQTRLSPLAGPSVFANDLAAGTIAGGSFTGDFTSRFGLVADTRNNEVAPTRGVFIEAIFGVSDAGFGSDASYTRTTLSARGYVPAGDLWSFAGRVLVQTMGGSPPLSALYLIDETDRVNEGVGGRQSHRAIRRNRLLGRNKFITNAEVRYVIYGIPTLTTLSAVGFIDAGRVFEPDPFTLTFSDMLVGGGGGIFFQLGPRIVVGSTIAAGPDGLIANFHTQWPF